MSGRGRVHLAIGVAVAFAIIGSAMAKVTRSDLGNNVIIARTTSWESFVVDGDPSRDGGCSGVTTAMRV